MEKPFTLHDLPGSERPRERIKRLGPEALSAQELLALIMGWGIRGESVLITAQRLLSSFGNPKGISLASLEELAEIRGVGTAKAAQLKAAFELARRSEEDPGEKRKIKYFSDVVKLLRPRLKNKQKEHFLILSLDSRNRVNRICEITTGTLDSSLAHPREVFKEAIQSLASSIILVHNHPSGHTEPSDDDIGITRKIAEAGKIIGIKVLDHIIIGSEGSFSFQENGLLE